jgi:hypothetical protein
MNLNKLTKLCYLRLSDTHVSDAGPAHLERLTKLTILQLGWTQVTDAGLVHLKGLTNLSNLDLMCLQVTDAGLVHLKGLTKLRLLNLSGTQVTDAGVRDLNEALPKLSIQHWHLVDQSAENRPGRIARRRDVQSSDARSDHVDRLDRLTASGFPDVAFHTRNEISREVIFRVGATAPALRSLMLV